MDFLILYPSILVLDWSPHGMVRSTSNGIEGAEEEILEFIVLYVKSSGYIPS